LFIVIVLRIIFNKKEGRRRMSKRISYETIAPYVDSERDCKPFLTGQLDTLKARCELLSGMDRVVMELFLQGQCKYAELAVLMGISESALSRRVQRLIGVLGGRYPVCLRYRRQLSPLESKIARLAFLDGWTLRQIAGHTGLSLYRVRKIARKLKSRADTDFKNRKMTPILEKS
jgi:DNA-directed RNA polymerase specialized sigma subunit